MLRVIGRELRRGLVVAGVCLGIAVVTGLSGFLFSDSPGGTRMLASAPPSREAASSSSAVLARWIQHTPTMRFGDWVPGGPEVASAAASAGGALQRLMPSSAVSVADPVVVPAPESPRADVGTRVQRQSMATPKLIPGDRPVVTVSFYYCEEVPGAYEQGDGGGFCGRGRDGSPVRSGMAACDVAYLGQRFRIDGDPTGRTYVCADTGSAVHGLHRDIWFMDNRDGWIWQLETGTVAAIEVLR